MPDISERVLTDAHIRNVIVVGRIENATATRRVCVGVIKG